LQLLLWLLDSWHQEQSQQCRLLQQKRLVMLPLL
jgi:hypothetical protein